MPVCSNTLCGFTCISPYILCNGTCVDTTTDSQYCGSCTRKCNTTGHGTTSCSNSQCVTQCDSGYALCSGQCVDTSSNKQNCGGCGITCTMSKMCVAGLCQTNKP